MTRKPAIVFITGPKHAGKTSAGKALARLLNCPFIDLDDEVEAVSGKSPRDLYRAEGLEGFRAAEALALRRSLEGKGAGLTVAAAGGGIIDNPAAMKALRESGAVLVCLELSPGAAWERIRASGGLPPFLNTDTPEETHRALHQRRSEAYRRAAHIIIKAEGREALSISREIAARLPAHILP